MCIFLPVIAFHCNVSVQVDCRHGRLRCLEAHTWSSVVLFLSHRNRCCCHVQHLHPKETRNSSEWRPFTNFQLSSKTQVQHQPLLQPTHQDPSLIQTHFPLARLALFLVRIGFCFAKTVLYLLVVLVLKVISLSFYFKGSFTNVYLTIKRLHADSATLNRLQNDLKH